VDTALERVRQAAKREKGTKLTALMHHVTLERLRSAYQGMNQDAAAGIDGVTWQAYGENLEGNLQSLLARVHRGSYRASPTRRVYIPKADGRLRPLGVATLEDKLLQRAVAEVMNGIYEMDFLGFSYGFRPGRSQHHALDALAYGLCKKKVSWVLDADIRGFFDAIDHEWLVRFVEHRIGDKRLVRLLQKWLRSGVMEDGAWTETDSGTAQGAAISPLLANVYLHYVLDLWAQQWRKRHARGEMIIVRYADDFIVGFERQEDGKRFLDELGERLAKFKLELHPDKTRLIEFGRYAAERRKARGLSKPETFTFLGLTHICGVASNGGFQLLRHTAKPRLRNKLQGVKVECRRRMHLSISEQGKYLKSVLKGYYQYHAVPTNERALKTFRAEVQARWKRVLSDRSQRGHVTWERMHELSRQWLPRPKILHPWPEKRFADRLQGRSPVR
jgi:RNA-directed DNA polymerase